MPPLLHSELFRLSRRWMPRILAAVLTLTVGTIYLLLWTVVRTQSETDGGVAELRENLRLEAVRDTGLYLTFIIGTILTVILTASLIGTEFSWGTIRTLLPRAVGRTELLTAKLITAILFVVAVVLIGTVVSVGASIFVTVLEDLPRSLGNDGLLRLLASIGRTIFVMLPYVALTFFVTVWTRSVAAGVGIGISMLFMEGLILALVGIAGGPFERIPGALISRNVDAVLAVNSRGIASDFADPSSSLPGAGQAAAILALYTVAFIVLSYQRFRTRDITVG